MRALCLTSRWCQPRHQRRCKERPFFEVKIRPRETPGQHWGQTPPNLTPSCHKGTTVTNNTPWVRKQQSAQRTRVKVVCCPSQSIKFATCVLKGRRRLVLWSLPLQLVSGCAGSFPPVGMQRLDFTGCQAVLGLTCSWITSHVRLLPSNMQRKVVSPARRAIFAFLMNLTTEASWPCVSQTASAGPSDLMATLAAWVSEEPLLLL